jgi:hypothetical protein
VKVHYEGTPVSTKLLTDHDACIAEWQAIRASHLANTKENYSDIAYNYGACPHGYLLEGRGIGKRTGANGNQPLNVAHYAIVGLVGDEGLTEPTDAMLGAIRDGIELLRQHGAGTEIKGHRDGYATILPGRPALRLGAEGRAPARRHGDAARAAPAKPKVSLAHVVYAAKHDPAAAQGHTTYKGEVLTRREGAEGGRLPARRSTSTAPSARRRSPHTPAGSAPRPAADTSATTPTASPASRVAQAPRRQARLHRHRLTREVHHV